MGVLSPEECLVPVVDIVSLRAMCASLLPFAALKISIGKSATPIVMLLIVPSKAEAPPEIGSQGPSSVSYSFGR